MIRSPVSPAIRAAVRPAIGVGGDPYTSPPPLTPQEVPPDPDPGPQIPVYDPAAQYPHLNGDGHALFTTWTPGTNFQIRGRVTPTIAGTRVLLGQLAETTNYISFFANSQRLGVKLGGGTAVYITKDYLNTEVEFTLVVSGGVGTLTWGADSVQVTAGASPIAFDTFGRNSISFSPYDGWMQEMDLLDTDAGDSNSGRFQFNVAGQITDAVGGIGNATLQAGLDITDWMYLP